MKHYPKSSRALAPRLLRSRRRFWLLALLVLLALSLMDRQGWLLVRRVDDMAVYHGRQGRIVRIIDGDTFEIDLPDPLHERPVTRIRIWGIDCPERASNGQEAAPFSHEATTFVREMTAGGLVTLSLEPHRTRGTFGRVLAHVDVPDRGSLNLALLEAGLAVTDDRWPHKHLKDYAKAQRLARRKSIGQWMLSTTIEKTDR